MNNSDKNSPSKKDPQSGLDLIRRQMYIIGNWFCGTLEGMGKDELDTVLKEILKVWLSRQVEKYDTLSIGYLKCTECGYIWEALAYSSKVKQSECPECKCRKCTDVMPGDLEYLSKELTEVILRVQK